MLSDATRVTVLEALEVTRKAHAYSLVFEPESEEEYALLRNDVVQKHAAIDAAIAEVNAEAECSPDWTQAPEWAQWWAMDADGAPYWFEEKPERHLVTWQTAAGRWMESDRKPDVDWSTTLQERTGSQAEATDD